MNIQYVAFNGITFDYAVDCADYERKYKYPNIKIFDGEGDEINTFFIASYVLCNNEEEYYFVQDMIDAIDFNIFDRPEKYPCVLNFNYLFDEVSIKYQEEDNAIINKIFTQAGA